MPPTTPPITPPTAPPVTPPSRNAPCPCGSGQRYKDCHGALGSTVDPARASAVVAPTAGGSIVSTADALLRDAHTALAQGDATLASSRIDQALALAPHRADLLLARARVEFARNDATAAAAACRAALAI